MSESVDPRAFRFDPELGKGVAGKRVLITGSGKEGGIGQALAYAAAMNGAESVAVHYYGSWDDGLATVEAIREAGGTAFPVQADVTNPGEVWSTRSHVIRKMGGKPPNLVICNSGLSEQGYLLGRVPKEAEGEEVARRRARARRAFMNNLVESHQVLDTKVDGFLNMTHMWAGEATWADEELELVYVSSRQAVEPGAGVPGYVLANWAVLALPRILEVNLGRKGEKVSSFCVAYPFVHTGMTDAYAENEKVFGRWQPRMLETREAALTFLQLLGRSREERAGRTYQLEVEASEGDTSDEVLCRWAEVRVQLERTALAWSEESPVRTRPSGS